VKRGQYLVTAVMACDNCHTPRTPNGLDMTRRFSGGSLVWDEKTFKVKGSNITPDITTGIGAWSDADIKRALTDGIRPDETPLAPIMPFAFYKILTERDLDAIVAYMRTISNLGE
jgi:mono/diheme cytochrome c family protein